MSSTKKNPTPKRVKWSVGAALKAPGPGGTSSIDTRIVETLPLAELEKLPKLSAVLIEFAEPLTSRMSAPIDKENLEQAMMLAAIAWNVPFFQQTGTRNDMREIWESTAAEIPQPIRQIIEAMMIDRQTRYRHDPRVANVEVKEGPGGKLVVYAATMALSEREPEA